EVEALLSTYRNDAEAVQTPPDDHRSTWQQLNNTTNGGRTMSVLRLVRHAQASFHANNYDELSTLGQKQAQLLGEFWARRRIDFDEVYCGPRVRQSHTAEIVGSAYARAGKTWPEPVVLAELDEYDLGGLVKNL